VRDYEVTIIIQPQLDEEARTALIDRFAGLIADGNEDNKPEINHWGLRQLAYPIRKHKEGYYVLYEGKIDPTRVKDIERNMQYAEDILRYLVVRKES